MLEHVAKTKKPIEFRIVIRMLYSLYLFGLFRLVCEYNLLNNAAQIANTFLQEEALFELQRHPGSLQRSQYFLHILSVGPDVFEKDVYIVQVNDFSLPA